jgi:hypothetical protein
MYYYTFHTEMHIKFLIHNNFVSIIGSIFDLFIQRSFQGTSVIIVGKSTMLYTIISMKIDLEVVHINVPHIRWNDPSISCNSTMI